MASVIENTNENNKGEDSKRLSNALGDSSKIQMSTCGDSENREKNGGIEKIGRDIGLEAANQNKELDQERQSQQQVSKLQQDIESLKGENLTDPIVIKHLHDDLFPSNPQFDATKHNINSSEVPQDSSLPNSDSSKLLANAYSSKISDTSQSPPLNSHADFFGTSSSNRSASSTAGNKKSVSALSSSLDSHNYFNDFLDHDPEGANEQYHFVPASGIHGSTSKVVANQHRRKAWDWNLLPKVGASVLVRAHSFNVVFVPIDGEIKQILYNPTYNKNFRTMNIFVSFNLETTPKDSLVHSKKRLASFGNYITHYLKSRMYAYQCYPFFIQGSEEDTNSKTYASVNSSYDYAEIEAIISLWNMQAQKFYTNTNSSFFSSEVVQILLQRKAHARHKSTIQKTVLFQEKGSTAGEEKIVTECFDDIDILLLRPLADTQLGWQIAYDEPNLNIADYPLDLSPWRLREENSDKILGPHMDGTESSQVKIVSDESELDQVNRETAAEYLFDCMGRKIGTLSDDFAASSNQMGLNTTEENQSKASTESTKKKHSVSRPAKRSGLANLFKRKHTATTSETLVGTAESDSTESKNRSKRTQSIQNSWLEDYFSRSLGNYKRVGLPTQYYLPEDITTSKSHAPTDDEISEAKKAFLFSKESLQIRLPFADNMIPTIYAPWVWSCLSYNKWKPLLREMYRCIIPGGFALSAVYDLKIANTFTSCADDPVHEFPSTLERDKTFDAITLKAMNDGVHIFPTKHFVQAFKSVGFSNVKFSLLSLKTGDFSTEMGCLNELSSQIVWDILLRKEGSDPNKPPKDTNPTTLFQRYTKEHMGKIDENAGCFRVLLIVGQKLNKNIHA